MRTIRDLLDELTEKEGSDLHITSGSPPRMRVNGQLRDVDMDSLSPEETKKLIYDVLTPAQIAVLEEKMELDLSVGPNGKERYRTNVFFQRGAVGAVLRAIPSRIKSFEELGLPELICKQLCSLPRGLILVTGTTGCGKSTTLASMINFINETRSEHIVTVEDPIEYIHMNKKSHVNQREVGQDTRAFAPALRGVLRQDPDVVLIGEMRDLETIEAALTISETGHLTFGTLHTSDAVQTVNRIVDVFPPHQQQQIRTQLSFTLQAVITQGLIEKADGSGRALAAEVLVMTSAVRALIRDSKVHQIYSIIQTNQRIGMMTMNQSLANLVKAGEISAETAVAHTSDPEELTTLIKG